MTPQGPARSPKSDPGAQAVFRRLVPDDERVTTRPMFGSLAAFANGYMFMGLFGAELFVRLPEAKRQAQAAAGWHNLEPMPGKPMREYLVIPGDWRLQPELVRSWGSRALDYVTALPPKK